ncbi:MAG: hypothetical protein IJW77_03460, partial [Clostridia bacterium]|nr:hypothetical protein [Clostridia bacterium]
LSTAICEDKMRSILSSFDHLRPTGKQASESGALSFLFLVTRPRMSTRQIARSDSRFFAVYIKDSQPVIPVNCNL